MFKEDVAKFKNLVERRAKVVISESVTAMAATIIKKTPVDAPFGWYDEDSVGEARGGWRILFDDQTGFKTGLDPDGGPTIEKAKRKLRTLNLDQNQTIRIENLVSYTHILEYGRYKPPYYNFKTRIKSTEEGFSYQAPNGMVRVSLGAWPNYLQMAIAKAKTMK